MIFFHFIVINFDEFQDCVELFETEDRSTIRIRIWLTGKFYDSTDSDSDAAIERHVSLSLIKSSVLFNNWTEN